MPRIMPSSAFARPRSMAARMVLTAAVQSDKDGLADQEMSDIELHDLRKRRDRLRARIIEAMAGMHFEPKVSGGQGRAFADTSPLLFALRH